MCMQGFVLSLALIYNVQKVQSQIIHTTSPGSIPVLTRIEYYIDTDPGYGLATNVSFTSGIAVADQVINIDPATVSTGVHRVGIRAKDTNGAWSLDNNLMFYKPASGGTNIPPAGPVPVLSRIEYYLDTDPGYGLATTVPFIAGASVADQIVNIDLAGLTSGVHRFGIRSRDANGTWSLDNSWLFYKPYNSSGGNIDPPPAIPVLSRVEYYFDTDPGYGNGIAVAINPVTNLPDFSTSVNVTGLSVGAHNLGFRSRDANGAWSLDNKWEFTVPATLAAPSIVTNSVTKLINCAKDSLSVSYHATGTFNNGNIFNVELSDATGSFSSPSIIGSYAGTGNSIVKCKMPAHATDGANYRIRVSSTNPVITGVTGIDLITIYDRPYAQTITGLSSVNRNETWPYSVPTATSSTWNWLIINGVKTIGANTNNGSIQWAAGNTNAIKPAAIKVVETSQYGCIGDTSNQLVNIYKLRIGHFLSTAMPCLKDSVTVTVNVDGAFYATPSTNQFIAELSNATGSFTTPTASNSSVIGAITGVNQTVASIKIGIPSNLPNGTNYRIRIRSTNPAFMGDTSVAISIQKPDLGADITRNKCIGFVYDLRGDFINASLTYTYFTNTFVSLVNPGSAGVGTYNVIGTNTSGCSDTALVTVINYPKPNLGADLIKSKCVGYTYSLTGVFTDPALSYSYLTDAFLTVANPLAVNVGVYNILATYSNGCADTAMVTITNFPKPALGGDLVRSKCIGFNYNLTTIYSNATLTYTYFTQAFGLVGNPASAVSGVYNIVATNSDGCKDTAQVTVNNFNKPAIGQDISGFKCIGATYSLSANYSDPTLSYNFLTQAFALVANPGSVDIGVYNVIATNTDGCRDTAIITVSNSPKPNLGGDLTRTKCPGFFYDLTGVYNTAGITYTYYDQDFNSVANPSVAQIGVYNIIATNTDGCKDTAMVTMTNNIKPSIGADITVYHNCGNETTNLVPLYNTTGLTAIWNTSNTVAAPPGIYRLIVTNSSGCTDTAFANIILEVAVWNGSVSNNWHTAANWSGNKVPELRTHVIIPSGATNPCNITTGDGEAASVQVQQGGVLQVKANRKILINQNCITIPVN